MNVAIPHDLGRDEVRRRLRENSHEIADYIPGGLAEIETDWPSEDRMGMSINAMGQMIRGHVDIEDTQLVFQIMLPPALGFIKPMVEGAIRQSGQHLIAPPKDRDD
ncbi:polyhydroxyalkanoic acid system family protein [Aurantiacibacter aquimixticola]|uniref:Polyhydroxyalkanoic acid system protein n=1 Tax=Aurantiacibacter aquimixticola TaxID=1958945 RepID=A0A419RVN6_9SPHN|nr:polyhydroxyalkanoic acid system family protein [Aurantiacibacter aquimixticola]RJY09833.1 hypothetical protein D6201_11125 [Aurantiacibacter aquimixticola]